MSSSKKTGVVLYQPDRKLLFEQIGRFSRFISGVVVDIGCGGVRRYERLFYYSRYITTDIDASCNPDIVCPIDSIPLQDNSVDSIVCTQVLEHVDDPNAAVKEFYRIQKTGGYCIITVPQWGNLHEEPHDYWRYTKYGISNLFQRNGYEIISIEKRGGFFVTSLQMWIRYFIERFDLYNSFFWKIWNILFRFLGVINGFLDNIDTSNANRTHAIGWAIVVKKI
jgi:SAM-dependent methyltransferase